MKIFGILSMAGALWKVPGYFRKGKQAVEDSREAKRLDEESGERSRPERMADHRGRKRR
jgi:hypothetical protein